MDVIFLVLLATTLVDVFVTSTSATWLPNDLRMISVLPSVRFLNMRRESQQYSPYELEQLHKGLLLDIATPPWVSPTYATLIYTQGASALKRLRGRFFLNK